MEGSEVYPGMGRFSWLHSPHLQSRCCGSVISVVYTSAPKLPPGRYQGGQQEGGTSAQQACG